MSTAGYRVAKAFEKQQAYVAWGNSVRQRFDYYRRGLTVEGKRPSKDHPACPPIKLIERDSGEHITVGAVDAGIDFQVCAVEWMSADPPQRTRFESLSDYIERGVHENTTADLSDEVLDLISMAESGDKDAIKVLMERYKKDPKPKGSPEDLSAVASTDDLNPMAVGDEATPFVKNVSDTTGILDAPRRRGRPRKVVSESGAT